MQEVLVKEQDLKISLDCLKTVENEWEFFFKEKRENEVLGIASVKKDNILWSTPPYSFYQKYLEAGRFLDPEVVISRKTEDYRFYQTYFELFPKLVWLLDDYLKNEKFDNLVGLLYNPTIGKYEVHPGASRQILLQIWSKPKIRGLIFSPLGLDFDKEDFEVIFNSEKQIKSHFPNSDVKIGLTPDKGTIFPHIHFDMTQIEDKTLEYHIRVNKYLDNTYLYFPQFEKDWLISCNNSKKRNTTRIILDDKVKDSKLHQLVSLATACLGMNIKFKGIEITHLTN